MKNALELYNDILFLNHRPWLFGKQSDTKFKQLISEVKKEYYSTQPNYEIDFIKPLSNIRKYYHVIIEHEAIRYLNDLHSDVSEALNKNEKSYLVHFALTKTFSQKIKETAQVIQERNYSPEQFDLSKQSKPIDNSHADESYILHLLKHQMARLIMEVQDSYTDLLKDDPLSQEEIYYKYFNEAAPVISFIIEAENYPNTNQIIQSKEKEDKPTFNAIREDIREANKNIHSYSQLVKNPSRFAQIEEGLFENGLINENYVFSDEYGKKKYLAAFYHQLIRKGYFNKRIFPENIEAKDLFIRKFLDHRYNTDVDKQFRNWDNNRDELLKFIEKDYWLDKISPC
ncbi:hypothetical protein HNS38_16835 [Lentimicrobium sp. L6]|uniref:DUF6617 family protein n=1 Tax=Lentimicrobium sp. L6 TaxID=2735916 RepID=UPI0015528BD2|nr:DUF6617 family protein [Lentimicrobium sp. L6]NPD86441.1 hypothetical protein [Lentimicrobium sp. L6]